MRCNYKEKFLFLHLIMVNLHLELIIRVIIKVINMVVKGEKLIYRLNN